MFQLNGASNVTITDLTLTGANGGIVLDTNTNANNVTISNDVIENNQTYGIYVGTSNNNVTVEGTEIFGSVNGVRNYGIYLTASGDTQETATIINNQIFGQYVAIEDYVDYGGLIQGNSIHDNSGYGLYLEDYNGPGYPSLTATGNNVFNNGNTSTSNIGIYAYGQSVIITGNAIYGQTASGDAGLALQDYAVATGNTIYNNYTGIYLTTTPPPSPATASSSTPMPASISTMAARSSATTSIRTEPAFFPARSAPAAISISRTT